VQRAHDDDERGQPDRHVDVEDPAPAVDPEQRALAGEGAADDRPETLLMPNTAMNQPW
jgi:hypothetical protein